MNMLPYMAEKTSDLIKLRLLNRGEIILGYQGEPHVITAASKREAGRVGKGNVMPEAEVRAMCCEDEGAMS